MTGKKFYLPEFGYEVVIGKYANQADGAAWFVQGGTVILSTATSASSTEFPGFFPLTIDYREHFAAAGKIPGGYFKREGKSSDKEVLVSRLIDRAVRPFFPANYFDQVQIISTVYSVDKENTPYVLALLASSISLIISKIPFMGPIGAVEVVRLNGQWTTNAKFAQTQQADSRITFAGNEEGICMVEGSASEISEKEFIDAMFMAHEVIKKQVAWQKSIAREINTPKEEIVDQFDWTLWRNRAKEILTINAVQNVFKASKVERGVERAKLKNEFLLKFEKEITEIEISSTFLEYIFDTVLKEQITELIFEKGKRIDGRNYDQVRLISVEVGLLPFNHGSALFQRGGTQALVSLTLGGAQDEQRIEDIMDDGIERSFMLHYNFPPYSVGEVRPLRGPGRREVGHGYLAASAISKVLPKKENFPYTIRIVADILSSDGSTSMATVCGSTMALMQAGVPIKEMVSGVAMGLLMNKTGDFKVLTDISGIEDEFGMMDFKVAGTDKGVTAIQMDIKYKGGLKREIFEKALEQARVGRLFILGEMRKVMTEPNKKLSDLVPQVTIFKVPTDKIGAIIGTGGKVIREIIEKTGTTIDIEEDGTVKIYGHPSEKTDTAINWVKLLGGLIEKGSRHKGRIKRFADFGIFVEIVPGLDGLVHVSTLARNIQSSFDKHYKIDQPVTVEVVEYDESSGKIRLKLIEQQQ
ncbi:polyribonucleotide nucleotidyltransferase [Candidatus Dependentiae bacterium]|nr:polyribonucleotide nucleotidyltransferase [Candidatus Dependentiae bacterium]